MKKHARAVAAIIATLTMAPSPGLTAEPTEQVRKELLQAREAAWHSAFQDDPVAATEAIIAPEVLAIQPNSERWENRESLIAMGKAVKAQKLRMTRLEFPHTQMQVFGDTAILYYTYLVTTANEKVSGTSAGRATEVFVRRNGRWIDVGFHLDNGAFVQRNGQWVRLGAPVAEPK